MYGVVDFERSLDLVKMGSESGRYLFTVLPPNKLPKAVVGKRRISHLPSTGGSKHILTLPLYQLPVKREMMENQQ